MIKEIITEGNFHQFAYRIIRWHFNYLVYGKASPLACGYYITSKCNFKCEFCNIWRIKPGYQVCQEDAMKVIKELGEMGLIYFSFSGGEPLLVPYVFDLLAYAKKCGILYTHLVSNGYLMDKERAQKLASAKVSEVSFSLDGKEGVHNSVRGMKDAYKKLLEAIENVKIYSPKTNIVLNTILFPTHPENALDAVEIAKQMGVKIKVQPANDHPSFGIKNIGEKTKRGLYEEEKQKLLQAIDYLQTSPQVVNSKAFLEHYKNFLFQRDKLIFSKKDCIFGYHHIEFFNNSLFPCLEALNWKDGVDLSNNSLQEILNSTSYQQKLQQLKKCPFCQNNFYICYYEPRLNFPIWNQIYSLLPYRNNLYCL